MAKKNRADRVDNESRESQNARIFTTYSPWKRWFHILIGLVSPSRRFLFSAHWRSITDCLQQTKRIPDAKAMEYLKWLEANNRRLVSSATNIVVSVIVAAIGISTLLTLETKNSAHGVPVLAFVIGGYLLVWVATVVSTLTSRSRAQYFLSMKLAELLFLVEFNARSWKQPDTQRIQALHIEKCASLIENLPYAYGGQKVAGARAVVSRRALAVANRFRGLELWIAFPMENTYVDFQEELVRYLLAVIRNEWYSLPQEDLPVNVRSNRLERIGLSVLVVILFAGLLAMLIWHEQFGATGTVVSSILGVLIVLILSRLGLSIASLQQAADASKAAGFNRGDDTKK